MLKVNLKKFMKSWGNKMAYNNKKPFFFLSTQNLDQELGHTLNFIWANYVSLRDMWWQVRGYNQAFPTQNIDNLNNKFLSGLPNPGKIDLKEVCINTEWFAHENEFCKWLIFDCCTLYEGWLENICNDLFPPKESKQHSKNLQFPSAINSKGNITGYTVTLNEIQANKSQFIENEFYSNVKNHKLNKLSKINEYLIVYRYFKECRNTFIHSNGVVNTEVLDAYNNLNSIKQNSSILLKFTLNAPILGNRIKLNLEDCKLFSFIIRNIIATFDAELSIHCNSEKILENRIKNLIATSNKWKNISSDIDKKLNKIHRILIAARIPEPIDINNVKNWMETKNLI